MKSIKEVLKEVSVSAYTGSEKTYDMVKEQIREKYGDAEAEKYDPYTNCLTFKNWLILSRRVRKGEKALKSVTYVEKKNEKGEVVQRFPRTINLFYYLQVEPITK
jgi:hypothetical protein